MAVAKLKYINIFLAKTSFSEKMSNVKSFSRDHEIQFFKHKKCGQSFSICCLLSEDKTYQTLLETCLSPQMR